MIPGIESELQRECFGDKRYQVQQIVSFWKISSSYAKSGEEWSNRAICDLDARLPDSPLIFSRYNEVYGTFSTLLKEKLLGLPGPSEFAKTWSQFESRFDTRLLCLRPPVARGLPLCTLHDVFRRYLLAIRKPLPVSETAIAAMKSATDLCSSMGKSFHAADDNSGLQQWQEDRVLKFCSCVYPVLPFDNSKLVILKPRLNRHPRGADISVALLEVNTEPGTDGDAYMQAVRRYDLGIKKLQSRPDTRMRAFLEQGAPTFLLCVCGPTLSVAGGFHDGSKITVEPLGDVYSMLHDYTDERRNKLAQVLFALAEGIKELKDNSNFASFFPPSTPRVYDPCTLYGQTELGQLIFTNNITDGHRLLFTALLRKPSLPEPIPVLVKLVPGQYGEEVHRFLADDNLAPTLHAYSEREGAPKAYIMEYLDPFSWMTLSDFSLLPDASTSASSIRLSIDKVLDVLQANGMVHGDLRDPNIMVKVADGKAILLDGRAIIKVVDFDWAGRVGVGMTCYPLSRNEDIHWPGKSGGEILPDHDRQMINSWWPNFGKSENGE